MIYQIKNSLGQFEYFVQSQELVDANAHVTCFVGGEADAVQKQAEYAAQYLEQENYRFGIAKEIVDGFNTTWSAVTDIDNDSHAGPFYVFNTFTGQHENVETKAIAKSRMQELKNELLVANGFASVSVVDKIPAKQPLLEVMYGQVLGSIPVEIM